MAQTTMTMAEFLALSAGTKKGKKPMKPKLKRRKKADEPKRADFFRPVTEPITITVPLPPPLNHYYRTAMIANHAQTYIAKAGKEFRSAVIRAWADQAGSVTFQGRLAMRVEIIQRDKREADLDGYCKALLDSLEAAGAYANDRQIKLLIVHQELTEAPGRAIVTIGPKPGVPKQSTLFTTDF